MKYSIFTLDPSYSTTRLVSTIEPTIDEHPEAQFQTSLFLPKGKDRQGVGGLRTKGYFKHSYEVLDGQWYITDNFGLSEDDLHNITIASSDIPSDMSEYVFSELLDAEKHNFEEVKKREDFDLMQTSIISRLFSLLPSRADMKAKLFYSITENSDSIINKNLNSQLNIYPSVDKFNVPLITIITVVLNGEQFIEKTIKSILNLKYPNIEYIIIDGGSSDGTLEKIIKYQDHIDYWVSEKDKGLYNAMNKGIELAVGKYVGILNAGDCYESTCAFNVFKICNRKSFDFISGSILMIDGSKKWYLMPWNRLNTKNILSTPFPHPACFVSLNLYKKIGSFDENLKISADHDFMIRCIKENIDIAISDKIFTNYIKEGVAYSTPNAIKFKEKKYICKKNKLGFIFLLLNILLHLYKLQLRK